MSDTPPPAISVAQFRTMLPEFDDSSVYLDEGIGPLLAIASAQLNPHRWGAMYPMGVALFAAHQLSLTRQASITASRGGVPGAGFGVVQSKSINGVSVSYNTSMLMNNAGDWNLTLYGVRFIGWARMFGSGGEQVVGLDASTIDESQLLRGTAP